MAYTTLANVRAYLKFNASETGDDTLITGLIPYAQMLIDNYVGYSFEASSDTTRYFDAEEDVKVLRQNTVFKGLRDTLFFDTYLAQLTSVVFTGVTLQQSDYVLQPPNSAPYYALTILASSPRFWDYDDDPENAIAVTGRWAYSITAPVAISQLCIELTAYLYNQRFTVAGEGGVSPDGAVMRIPQHIAMFLDTYKKAVSWR